MTALTITVPLPADLAARDRHRRVLLRRGQLDHPALAGITAVAIVPAGLAIEYDVPADAAALALAPDPGGAAVPTRSVRPIMDAAQVLALMAPVAAGLAVLHDAGFASGGIAASTVLVRSDGSGVFVGWAPDATCEQDVADVCDLLAELLPEGSVGADVVGVLVAGGDPDPQARPTMARLAAVLDLARRSMPMSPPAIRRSSWLDGSASLGESPSMAGSALNVGSTHSGATDSASPWSRSTQSRSTESRSTESRSTRLRLGARLQAGEHGVHSRTRGRHAVTQASPGRWRWVVAATGMAVIAVFGASFVMGSDAQGDDVPSSCIAQEKPADL